MIVVCPLAGLGVWGYSYLSTCLQLLTAPGRPLEFVYHSPAGDLHLRVESFLFTPGAGTLLARNATLRDPDGAVLARVARLRGDGLYLLTLGTSPVRLSVSGASAVMELKADGTPRFLDYLPKPSDERGRLPLTVSMENLDVEVSTPQGFLTYVRCPQARVDAVGPNWLATVTSTRLSEGSVRGWARGTESKTLEIDLRLDRVGSGRFVRFFASTPDGKRLEWLSSLQLGELNASGRAHLFLMPDRAPTLAGTAHLAGRSVSYGADYRAEAAQFSGEFTTSGVRGLLTARQSGMEASLDGSATWGEKGGALVGKLAVRSPSGANLPTWAKKNLPKDLSFRDGSFEGWLAYTAADGARADGRLRSASAKVAQAEVARIDLRLHASKAGLTAKLEGGSWEGRPVTGFAKLSRGERVDAWLKAADVPIAPLAERFGAEGFRGRVDVSLAVQGSLSKPRVSARATGWAEAVYEGNSKRIRLGNFELAAIGLDRDEPSARLTIQGPNGKLAGQGFWNYESGKISADFLSSGIPLERLHADLVGRASLSAHVGGTTKSPRIEGRLEAFDSRYQDTEIPALATDLEYADGRLTATRLDALIGASQASGRFSVDLESAVLSGSGDATLRLSDYSEEAVGTVALRIQSVGGTLEKPVVQASLTSDKAFLSGLDLEDIAASAELSHGIVALKGLTARAGGGLITGTGEYIVDKGTGTLQATAQGLPLDRLSARFNEIAKLDGYLDAQSFQLSFGRDGLTGLSAQGELRQVEINDSLFDGGPWKVDYLANEWSGALRLGVLERFIQVPQFSYNTQSRSLTGELLTYDLDLSPLVAASLPYIQEPSHDQKLKPLAKASRKTIEELKQIDGLISAALKVDGPIDNLSISEGVIEAARLRHDEMAMGNLHADFTRTGRAWKIGSVALSGGPLGLSAKGTVDEEGAMRIDGEANVFDAHWFSRFDPVFSPLYGTASIPFLVDGPTSRPLVQGSVDLHLLEAPQGVPPTSPDAATLAPDEVTSILLPFTMTPGNGESYLLEGKGKMNLRFLSGDLAVNLPMNGPFALSDTDPWKVSLTAQERTIGQEEIQRHLPGLDAARTHLSASGTVTAEGLGSKPRLSGELSIRKNPAFPAGAGAIALAGFDTHLSDLSAFAKLDGEDLRVDLAGRGSTGGVDSPGDRFEGSFTGRLSSIDDLFDVMLGGSADRLLAMPVAGRLAVDRFGVREGALVKGSPGDAGSAAANLSGTIHLDRTLGRPHLRTTDGAPVRISHGDFSLPTLPEREPQTGPFAILPSFDIKAELQDPAKLRAGNTAMTVTGSGSIGGSLELPEIVARMNVVEGTLRLPTSRVRLQEGGDLHLQYRARPGDLDPFARLDVNLHGKTNLTALRFGSLVERYDIDLFIRGDLLSDQPVALVAQSTPGDLSSAQIVRLLGQADLLESLTTSVRSGIADRNFQQAFGTFAVPALFDPFAEQVAKGLGLDYISVEYNALEQATITVAKTLASGLTLQFRRQLLEPPAGELQRFDLRLTYRLPGRSALLNRLAFIFGRDQDRPWKLGLEYSSRF